MQNQQNPDPTGVLPKQGVASSNLVLRSRFTGLKKPRLAGLLHRQIGDTLLTEQGARESSQIRSQFGIIIESELRLKDGSDPRPWFFPSRVSRV